MKRSAVLVAMVLGVFLLCFTRAQALDSVKIAMGYIPNVQFAPYYAAVEKGYFREEGLSVSFDYGMTTDIMSLVGSGQITFGITDGEQVIVAREKGIPVRVVYSMYVKYPVAVVSFKEKGITQARDLKGKRVGTPAPYGSNYFGLRALLRSADLTLADIDLKFIGYTQVESLIADRVDAAVVFVNNEVVVLRQMGKQLNVLETSSIIPMVSASIIASDDLIGRDPQMIQRFIRAVVRGSRYVLREKGSIVPLLKTYIPTLSEQNMELNEKVLLASLMLWNDEDTEKHGLGYSSERDWVLSVEEMYALGIMKTPVDAQECYTNRFIEP